jgi:predicted permease
MLRHDAARLTAGRRRARLRDTLVVVQVALTIVLLSGAALLTKSFLGLMQLRPGLSVEHLLTGDLRLSEPRATDPAAAAVLVEGLAARIRRLPGVTSVAIGSAVPFGVTMRFSTFSTRRTPAANPMDMPSTILTAVGQDYFRTLGARIIRGRGFGPAELARSDVAVVNQALASTYFPGENPIGQWMELGERRYEIIGIVESVRQAGLELDLPASTYVPLRALDASGEYAILVHTDKSDPARLAPALEEMVGTTLPGAKLRAVAPMSALLGKVAARPHVYMVLLGAFALLALILTAIGLYGVISYSVAQRTREIGIRIALGAAPGRVRGRVVSHGLLITAVGLVGGGVTAVLATRLIQSLLYGVSTTDPVIYVAVAAMLGAVAFAACYLPARRAAAIDPIIALRTE